MKQSPIRIVHITDTHITGDPGTMLYGVDSFKALQNVLTVMQERCYNPNVLVATGDLSEDGSEASYRRLRSLLTPLDVPVHCLPGNHDVLPAMQAHLHGGHVRVQHQLILDEWQIIFLDTHIPGDVHGYLVNEELSKLDAALSSEREHYALVCLHHGPLPVCPMLPCRLENAEKFFELIRRHPNVRGVVSGHNHCAVDEEYDGTRLLVTPSTFVQICHPDAVHAGNHEIFWDLHSVDTERQGFRLIELHANGVITTEVVWVLQTA